jgi:hypothetical protein
MSHPYLISKYALPPPSPLPPIPSCFNKTRRVADPLFALLIGSTSAVLRIQRDMRDQSVQSQSIASSGVIATASAKSQDVSLSKIAEIGARRVGRWWRGEFQGL